MPNLIQIVIQKLNLRLLENGFMSIDNLGDSYKLSSSSLGIQVICSVCIVCAYECVHLKWINFCRHLFTAISILAFV